MTSPARALISTRKGLFTLTVDGGQCQLSKPEFPGVQVIHAVGDPRDGACYASLGHGHFGAHVHRSDDGGNTWVEVAAPEYPPKPDNLVEINQMTQQEIKWATELIWVIEPGHADEPGVIWAGTVPGGLFRSPDRGGTWELVDAFWSLPNRPLWFGGGFGDPGIHSIVIDPRQPGHLSVAISSGGVWRSADGGKSWDPRTTGMRSTYVPDEIADHPDNQDPHRVVRPAADPDVLWCQHHEGIWRSTDNGDHWVRIEQAGPSTFGFAVAAHPHDPDTAWFVPAISDMDRVPVDAKLVVTRTRDGGQTFDVLTDGLPQQHAYDLVYRHGLAVDGTGEQLLMGSTTGGLWYSANGGDAWTTVSTNLPPINAVNWI